MTISQALIKIFSLSSISFLLAIVLTPIYTNFVYEHKFGKKIRAEGDTPLYSKMHEKKSGTPTMGGILIWGTTIILAVVFWLLDRALGIGFFHRLNFLTRQQTLLPLGVFGATALLGLLDDYLGIKGAGGGKGGGLRMRYRLLFYSLVAIAGAFWFYYKLQFNILHVDRKSVV